MNTLGDEGIFTRKAYESYKDTKIDEAIGFVAVISGDNVNVRMLLGGFVYATLIIERESYGE